MDLPTPQASPPSPAPLTFVAQREDIIWGRPIFKAPKLTPLDQAMRAKASPVFTTAPRFRASQRRRRQP